MLKHFLRKSGANARPPPKDFNIPETDEQMEAVIKAMEACGMKRSDAELNIKSRRSAYNRAIKEYDKQANVITHKRQTRRNSMELVK